MVQIEWGRGGVEPPTSALVGRERSTTDRALGHEGPGVIRLDQMAGRYRPRVPHLGYLCGMTQNMKSKMLEALAETRRKEGDLEALCADAPPDPSGRWRAQDHLAHMAWSRQREATVIEAVRSGDEIPPEGGESQGDEIYAATRDQTTATVIANAQRSWDRIVSVIEACSEKDLQGPHPHRKGRKLVDGSPGDHLGAHLMWYYLEAGDEKAAEAIQLWARDLSIRTFDDPYSRAVATYNMACFYARVARPADAVPLLRESLDGAPDLKEWSLKDPDLDPIRQDPLFVELTGVRA